MATCILVLEDEKKAYDFWERVSSQQTQISNFQVIEPKNKGRVENTYKTEAQKEPLPSKVQINEVKLFSINFVLKLASSKFLF